MQIKIFYSIDTIFIKNTKLTMTISILKIPVQTQINNYKHLL